MSVSQQAGVFSQGSSTTGIVATATLVLCISVIAIGASGPNLDLALLSALALIIGVVCLWSEGEPPTLLLIFFIQWLQGSTAILQATLVGKPIDEFYEAG